MSRATSVQAADGALGRARALADPSRARVHRLLAASAAPLTIAELAAATELHRTAVGTHLARLVEAGLAERTVSAPSSRGRPVARYHAVDDDPYRSLSAWLVEGVRTRAGARELGRSVGGRMARAGDDPLDALIDEASRLGFAPELRQARSAGRFEVVLHTCPFADLASVDPDTVCDLHLGLAEGLTANADGITIDSLHRTDPHRGGCRLTVSRNVSR